MEKKHFVIAFEKLQQHPDFIVWKEAAEQAIIAMGLPQRAEMLGRTQGDREYTESDLARFSLMVMKKIFNAREIEKLLVQQERKIKAKK